MKKTLGRDVKISKDDTGVLISVDWDCPNCGEYNAGFYFSSNVGEITDHFEVEHECDRCHEMIAIECFDPEKLF